MSKKLGFDNEKYLNEQTKFILDRVSSSGDRLYLEFGGKLIFDYHASRVLPGFDPNVKMRLLQKLKDKADIILCIYAGDIERHKLRADFGITYDLDLLRMIDEFRSWGLDVLGVVITRFENQPAVKIFRNKLQRRGVAVYTHRFTKGYPSNVDLIVSDEGYGANEYIQTNKPLVIVNAPGPGSGKLATCLSQIYHEHKRGLKASYSKFETFPVWNLPLNHPVNVAYEAATADLGDVNMIDPFHLEAYNKTAINYNRDIEIFPVIRRILERIMGSENVYKSPTDMGVNRVGFGIIDDQLVKEAAKQEVICRFFRYSCEYAKGFVDKETVQRAELIMNELDVSIKDRKVVIAARETAEKNQKEKKGYKGIHCGAAIELNDGAIICGKNSPLMHAASSLVLNSIKYLAGIPDNIHLLSLNIIESIASLKKEVIGSKGVSLDLEEILIALSISAATNPSAKTAMDKLKDLRGCQAHVTHILSASDDQGLRSLGVNLTTDPNFSSASLFEF